MHSMFDKLNIMQYEWSFMYEEPEITQHESSKNDEHVEEAESG